MGSRERRAFAAALAVVLALAAAENAAPVPRPGQLRAYLPASRAVPGWAVDGEPREFEGESLYDYIDGGAEIYHEYGFRRVVVQDYASSDGLSISLEIFEMADPEAAFGMYSFKRSGSGRALDLGAGGELEAYYLNCWRGRFLVTLTGFDESRETVDGLLALGGKAASALPGGGDEPALVRALPESGLRAGSVKYLKGLLGLNSVYAFPTARGLDFGAGAGGLYEDGAALLLLDYGTAEARAAPGPPEASPPPCPRACPRRARPAGSPPAPGPSRRRRPRRPRGPTGSTARATSA